MAAFFFSRRERFLPRRKKSRLKEIPVPMRSASRSQLRRVRDMGYPNKSKFKYVPYRFSVRKIPAGFKYFRGASFVPAGRRRYSIQLIPSPMPQIA